MHRNLSGEGKRHGVDGVEVLPRLVSRMERLNGNLDSGTNEQYCWGIHGNCTWDTKLLFDSVSLPITERVPMCEHLLSL